MASLIVQLSTVDGRDVVVDVKAGESLNASLQRSLLTQRAMDNLRLLRRVRGRGLSTGATESFSAEAVVVHAGLHVPVLLDSTDRAAQITRKANEAIASGAGTAAPPPTVSVAKSVAAYEHKTKANASASASANSAPGKAGAAAAAAGGGKGQRSVYALRTDARSDSLLRQQPHVHAAAGAASAASAAADDDDDDEDDVRPSAAATRGAAGAAAGGAAGAKDEEEVWLPPIARDEDDGAGGAAFTPDLLAAKLAVTHTHMTEAQCREVFSRFDRNGDGHIDADELEPVCALTGVKPWRALKELDADRDGRISLSEFVVWWQRDRARIALEAAAGISYEHVNAFKAAPFERRRGSRNLHALTQKRDSLTAPPRATDALAPAHGVSDADVAAAATHRRTDSGGASGEAKRAAGVAAGAGAGAALAQMGSHLAAAARVAHGLELTPPQRAEVTKKFRAVQFAVLELEQYLNHLLAD